MSIDTLANESAESILTRYVVQTGGHHALGWTAEDFDAHRDELAGVIARRLAAITAPGYPEASAMTQENDMPRPCERTYCPLPHDAAGYHCAPTPA